MATQETINHRFLTPNGWRLLGSLRAGDLIAVGAKSDDRGCSGREQDFRGDCFLGCHLYGEFSNGEGLLFPDKRQQLVSLDLFLAHYADSLSRACIEDSSSPQYWAFLGAYRSCVHAIVDRMSSERYGTCEVSPSVAYSSGSLQSSRRHRAHQYADISDPTRNDCSRLEHDCNLSCCSQQDQQSRGEICHHQIAELPDPSVSYSYPEYTTKMRWAQITSITFAKEGDAYGLIVPTSGCYVSNNIISHNSPNLPHFQRSLWKEFQNWCPWDMVIPSHRRMANRSWMPMRPFDVVFENNTYLHCVGAKDIRSLEGPNLSFAHFDEARLFPDANAVKVLSGRIRIPGPKMEPPQMWMTTTPRMNWLHDFFGPLRMRCPEHGKVESAIQEGKPEVCPQCGAKCIIEDPYAAFKRDSKVITLHVRDNASNLSKDYVTKRAQSLTENEKAVLIDADWVDDESDESFLPSMYLWDACRKDIPPLTPNDPLVIGMDASELHDTFSLCAVSRSPWDPDHAVAVRYFEIWDPGGKLLDYRGTDDYPGPELRLIWLLQNYDVITVVYDPYQLHDFAQRMERDHGIWFQRFTQGTMRNESDRQLFDLIVEKRLVHNGNRILRDHVENANRRRTNTSGKSFRIVKKANSLPIDGAVAVSMAAHECLRLNL